jgi:hypothetical protein
VGAVHTISKIARRLGDSDDGLSHLIILSDYKSFRKREAAKRSFVKTKPKSYVVLMTYVFDTPRAVNGIRDFIESEKRSAPDSVERSMGRR